MAYALLLFVPLSLVLRHLVDAPPGWVFLTGAAAIIVLADWLRRATDQLAERAGSTIGGLLNISFGNTAELILALFVLSRAQVRIVQAQITGSIIGTTLLFLGISALVGGVGRVRQTFNQASAGLLSTLLFLVVVAILLTAVIALQSELVSAALETAAAQLRLSPVFLGAVVLALVGTVSDLFGAVAFARQDKMDIVFTICVGSAIQTALVVAPVLVLASWAIGQPMNLVFGSPLDLFAIAGAAFIVRSVAADGETTWFEGLLLVGVYLLFAIAYYFESPA